MLPYCDDNLTLYADGNLLVNSTKTGDQKPIFLACSLSTLAVLCYNAYYAGGFAAKSYNSLTNRLVTNDSWLVTGAYSDRSYVPASNWYSIDYDDSSWDTAVPFDYNTADAYWQTYTKIPELKVNDTFWFIVQKNPVAIGNNIGNVFYRMKISKYIHLLKHLCAITKFSKYKIEK